MVDVDDTETFEKGDSGASGTYPISCGEVKKGFIIELKGRPAKVVELTTSKTGKHGHAKANITAIDIFNGKKYEDICPVSHNKNVVNISRIEYQFLGVDDESYVTLMDAQGVTRQDLKLPDETDKDLEISKRIQAAAESGKEIFITVLAALGIEKLEAISDVNS